MPMPSLATPPLSPRYSFGAFLRSGRLLGSSASVRELLTSPLPLETLSTRLFSSAALATTAILRGLAEGAGCGLAAAFSSSARSTLSSGKPVTCKEGVGGRGFRAAADWFLTCLQGGRAHPLAACEVA